MLAELSCSCELTSNNALTLRLLDLGSQQVGLGASFVRGSDLPGATAPFAEGKFMATFTNVTDETITSVATGTVIHAIDGYTLQCRNVDSDAILVRQKYQYLVSFYFKQILHKHFSQMIALCLTNR